MILPPPPRIKPTVINKGFPTPWALAKEWLAKRQPNGGRV